MTFYFNCRPVASIFTAAQARSVTDTHVLSVSLGHLKAPSASTVFIQHRCLASGWFLLTSRSLVHDRNYIICQHFSISRVVSVLHSTINLIEIKKNYPCKYRLIFVTDSQLIFGVVNMLSK